MAAMTEWAIGAVGVGLAFALGFWIGRRVGWHAGFDTGRSIGRAEQQETPWGPEPLQ